MEEIYYTICELSPAALLLVWRDVPEFRGVALSMAEESSELRKRIGKTWLEKESKEAIALIKQLRHYFSGELDNPPIESLDLSGINGFTRKVLFTLRDKVPAGKVVTYGTLAAMSGFPRAARAAGSVMSNNPFPLFFPCHRVVLSGGRLGKFGPGQKLKQILLENEGVEVKPGGIIPAKYFL